MITDKTWLFVPAKEKYIKNIANIDSDVLILDLEDALAPQQKAEGLRLVIEAVKQYGQNREMYVRINADERMQEELYALKPYRFSGYLFPKFEEASVLENTQEFLSGKEVIALIESIKGVMQMEKNIAHPLVAKAAFGGEDFCRELGFGAGEEATLYARSKLAMYAAYYHKYSLDTISLEIRNREAFLESFAKTKRLGFRNKLLIHPSQVQAVRSFGKNADTAYLKRIVEQYYSSKDGIVQIDGEIYERPHILKIEKFLQESEGQ